MTKDKFACGRQERFRNDWPTLLGHVNVDAFPEIPQVREVMPVALDVAQPGFAATVEALRLHSWKLGPGQPMLVIDQFTDADFKLVVDDLADVHVNSKDGRFYLGWFPTGRPGTDGEGWVIAVTGTAKTRGYRISFDTETPADIVAAAVAQVLATAQPL